MILNKDFIICSVGGKFLVRVSVSLFCNYSSMFSGAGCMIRVMGGNFLFEGENLKVYI